MGENDFGEVSVERCHVAENEQWDEYDSGQSTKQNETTLFWRLK